MLHTYILHTPHYTLCATITDSARAQSFRYQYYHQLKAHSISLRKKLVKSRKLHSNTKETL